MQGLDRKISELYGLDVRGLAPYRDGYIVNTSRGRKMAKKTLLSPERILFVHGAKEHLAAKGYSNIDRFICTQEGEPGFFADNAYYTLSELIEGRECNLDNEDDVRKAAELLASLHAASRGYKPPEGCKVQDETGRLPEYFEKRLDDIKRLRKHAYKGKGRFDRMFLENVDYFINSGEETIKRLKDSNYGKLVEKCRQDSLFCHHDYTHYNIISGEQGFYVINFEYCCFELKIYDLANFIRRRMRKCDWNADKAGIILEGYTSREDLSVDDLDVMEQMLWFPQKFWRVVNKYYNSRRSWSERSYMSKLQEVIDETENHRKFMEKFHGMISGG
jgi:spore coat protein I